VRRSLALIAIGAAVAVAAAIVIAGMSSGGDAGGGASASGGTLPSDHPSIASGDTGGDKQPEEDDDGNIGRLEALRAEDPDDVTVLLDLGEAYFMAQRLDDAERIYAEALGAEPDNAGAQVGLAKIVHARGDSQRAEEALLAILEEHADYQDAHYWLAIVFFSDGEIDAAREQWRAAARIDPKSVTGRRSQSFVELLEDGQSDSPHATD
jgi:tetratricopeptide (TPR) repeat protein